MLDDTLWFIYWICAQSIIMALEIEKNTRLYVFICHITRLLKANIYGE